MGQFGSLVRPAVNITITRLDHPGHDLAPVLCCAVLCCTVLYCTVLGDLSAVTGAGVTATMRVGTRRNPDPDTWTWLTVNHQTIFQ